MRKFLPLLTLVIPALALGACDRLARRPEASKAQVAAPPVAPTPKAPAAPVVAAPTGFHHQDGFEAMGYYLPATQVRVGNFELTHVAIGSPNDFAQWEGGNHSNTFGPVQLEFDDVTSPVAQNEMGGDNHTVTIRVLPTAYNVDSHTLEFAGTSPQTGPVVLQARIDTAAFQRALNSGESENVPVARGVLMVGQRRFENLALTYFSGD